MEQPGLQFNPPSESDGTARPMTAEELQYTLHEHQKWLTLEGKEGKRANFRNADLRGMDFSNMHLAEASFRGANIAGVNFANADLRGADMAEADLQRSNLRGAYLMGANFARANLKYADLQSADLAAANFGTAQMEGVSLMNAKLHAANLRESDLRGAVLRHAILTEANFRGANLREAILEDANLSQADCRDANFENALFERTNIQEAIFRGAILTGVDMNKADFSTALDVSPEYHMQAYQNESRKLQEEQAQLRQAQEALQQERQQLEATALDVQRKSDELASARTIDASRAQGLHRIVTYLGICSVIWLAIVVGIVAAILVTAANIPSENLHVVEIAVVFVGLGSILLLFGMSWWQTLRARRLLRGMTANAPVATRMAKRSMPPLPTAQQSPQHDQPFIAHEELTPPPKAFGPARKGGKAGKAGIFGRKSNA